MIQDRWVRTEAADLHYLIRPGDPALIPVVYIPGSLGSASDFRDEMNALAPRATIAVSPRGLGRSSSSPTGYSFDHRLKDLAALLDELDPEPFCLMAYSLGVSVAIGYAARFPQRIEGLILLDYPARYPQRSAAWLETAMPFAKERGVPEHVLRGIQQESEPVELWDELEALERPILVVKGGKSNTVSGDELERYGQLPQVQVEIFEDSGHEIHKPDYGRFLATIRGFLEQLDRRVG